MIKKSGKVIKISVMAIFLLCGLLPILRVSGAGEKPGTGKTAEQKPVVIQLTASIVKKDKDGKWVGGWKPNQITVKQGQTVVLNITSLDTDHGFSLPDYHIDLSVSRGQPIEVSFVASKAGTFYYTCGARWLGGCGPSHKHMKGVLIVTAAESK